MPALMPLPSKITFVTFDVYGTLIDWESGVYDAFRREASKDGFTIDDRDEIIPRFHEYEREVEGGSYELYPAHFTECARRIGSKKGWVHVAASYYHDVEPCLKQKIPVIWVNRNKEELDGGQKKPTAEVKNLAEAAKLLGAA